MTHSKFTIVLTFIIPVVIVSCAGSPPPAQQYTRTAAPKSDNGSRALNQKLIQQTMTSTSSANYIIGPGDLLDIKVMQAPDLNTQTRVSPQNTISMPLLENVQVGGLTSEGVQDKVQSLLADKYMHDPHVVVSIAEYKSKRVAVIGSVQTPGSYELLGSGSLLDALALAGGLTPTASDVAFVTRKDANGASQEAIKVDLDELLDNGRSDLNLPISMGDIVYVPEAGVVYVEGAVLAPGAYPIDEGDTTVSQAITMAGGVASFGDDDVKLVRFRDGGQREVVDLNLDNIKAGTEEDPILNEQDAVIVGKNAFKTFFYGLRFNIFGFGGGYDPPSR